MNYKYGRAFICWKYSRKDAKKMLKCIFFYNKMMKTFLIQMFYILMTSLASNNVLNARPISIYDLYTLTNTSQTASFLASGFEQRCICIQYLHVLPLCFYFIIIIISQKGTIFVTSWCFFFFFSNNGTFLK